MLVYSSSSPLYVFLLFRCALPIYQNQAAAMVGSGFVEILAVFPGTSLDPFCCHVVLTCVCEGTGVKHPALSPVIILENVFLHVTAINQSASPVDQSPSN